MWVASAATVLTPPRPAPSLVLVPGLNPDMPVSEFLQFLEEKAGVPPVAAEVLAGFPPQPLQVSGCWVAGRTGQGMGRCRVGDVAHH